MRFGGFVNSPFNSRERDDFLEKEYARGREISATAAARKSDLEKTLQEMRDSTQLGIARIHDETIRRGQDLGQPLQEAKTSALNMMTPLQVEGMGLQNEGMRTGNEANSRMLPYLEEMLRSNQEGRELGNLFNRSAAISQLAQNRERLEEAGIDFGGLLERFGFKRSGKNEGAAGNQDLLGVVDSLVSSADRRKKFGSAGETEDTAGRTYLNYTLPRTLKSLGSYGIPIMSGTVGALIGAGAGGITVPVAGAIPGSVVGASLGAAAGELGRQMYMNEGTDYLSALASAIGGGAASKGYGLVKNLTRKMPYKSKGVVRDIDLNKLGI